jgi:hypothetical protein
MINALGSGVARDPCHSAGLVPTGPGSSSDHHNVLQRKHWRWRRGCVCAGLTLERSRWSFGGCCGRIRSRGRCEMVDTCIETFLAAH